MSETNDQRIYDRCIIRVGQLEAENEKLRELARDMWLQLLNAYDYKEVDEFADRMYELGMEVDV